ncbi:Uncharacterised protein [Mycobacteroides abscessus subsp. massiliense]|uniref:hypothetical protein n=1 Tax=Mycobacteroides abscessus TaxID=36809 RepID=UPI000927CA93|nr:hypothetical protein [Mycobacteroides abscessus]MBN7324383.1 hypothetical protein [Mycobacteroides abscessus subsp. massiliense]MBN7428759.1 hypothetical protein [Mycobacteroides abscessus subsp. massiliense]SHV72457.1 Uncharacterised protein [Mycobacteroides abscessus subsp. abscessus]SHW31004.1 Uncharacterised protein [Mycobacteroides abscessus subsp. abscessus]SHW41371.1 Uncharacterised protein [Mycobacteroides abscessus subsp. abscessus]
MATTFETIASLILGVAGLLTLYSIAIDKPLKKYQPIYERTHAAQLAARDERNRT